MRAEGSVDSSAAVGTNVCVNASADWLTFARGKKVKLVEPRRGIRARLVELADRNAAASAASRKNKSEDADAMLQKVADRLAGS